jgi:hypothetical protein
MPRNNRPLLPIALITLSLAALIALGWAARRQTTPEATDPVPEGPRWIAAPDAPRYLLRLDTAQGPALLDALGAPIAALQLRWRADYGQPTGEAGCAAEGTCTHQEDAPLTAWTARTDGDGTIHLTGQHQGRFARVQATWRATPGDPRLTLEVTVQHDLEAWPDREALSFTLLDDAAAMGRDLRFVSVTNGQRHHIDRWTPRRVIAGQGDRALHLLAQEWTGAELTGRPQGADLTLEWEDARDHPFRPLDNCQDPDAERAAHDREPRQGAVTRRATLQLGHTWMPWAGRAPEGRAGAVALLDVTPATTPAQLSALLWRHSDQSEPRFNTGGVLGHGLRLTRALYAGSAGLGNPPVANIVRSAEELGVRVANHSATAEQDPLDLNEAGMNPMAAHKATTWVEALDGCEDFHGDGWRDGKASLSGLLARHGYQYIWSGQHRQPAPGALNLLRPQDRDARAPLLWTHSRSGHAFHLFAAMDLTGGRARIKPLFQRAALDRLAQERGLLLARVSLDTVSSDDGFLRREGSHYITTTELEEILDELEHAQEEGDLWIATVEDLLTRLRALDALHIEPLPDGRLRLHNRGATDLLGLTLHLPGGRYELRPEGAALAGSRANGEGAQAETLAWLDLPAGAAQTLQILDPAGAPISPLIPAQWALQTPPGATTP